ncbi:hypothetical protein KC352_g36088, partial [Hortaea werneckii]
MSTLATIAKAIDLPHYQTKVDPEEADREALVAAEIDQGGRDQPAPYHLNADHIRADLTSGGDGERPNWPLSCYGPGRDAPRQLLEGAIEQSPEECRVLYHQAVAAGMVGEYANNETNAVNQANQQVQAILSDLDGAIKYVIEGERQHPNRLDHVVKSNQP